MTKVWTRIRATRRVRWRRRFRRLLPPVARSDGWRRYGGGALRVSIDEFVWLRNGALREDQQMRQDVAKWIQEMGRSRAHRRRRNRPDELADAAEVRRGIPSIWRCPKQEWERGSTEGIWGLL
jgi:hypothetical protein